MKKSVWSLVPAVLAAGLALAAAKEHTYVGASSCKLCHKAALQGRQFVIWEASLHSKSYAGLSSPEALEVAKSVGVTNPASNAQCLGCHAPLHAKGPELMEEGVTCEVCHGPGSGYKKLSIMQDKEKAVQNGLILYNADAGAIQAHCLKCHQNPHGNSFDFKASWERIKHLIPGK